MIKVTVTKDVVAGTERGGEDLFLVFQAFTSKPPDLNSILPKESNPKSSSK